MKQWLFILLVTMGLLACGGPQERKAQYRAKAQDYIQAGNYPKARVALRNVLKIDPKDAEAYFLVAQVEEKRTGAMPSPTTSRWSNSFPITAMRCSPWQNITLKPG